MAKQEIEIMLKEYEALRAEITVALESRHSILSFGLATIGILYTGVAAVLVSGASVAYSGFMLMAIIPFVSMFILFIWMGEYQRMQRAGKYIMEIEKRVNKAAAGNLMGWETFLRTQKVHMRYPYDTTIMLLVLIGLASYLFGLSFVTSDIKYLLGAGALGFGFFIAIYVYAISRMSELRS